MPHITRAKTIPVPTQDLVPDGRNTNQMLFPTTGRRSSAAGSLPSSNSKRSLNQQSFGSHMGVENWVVSTEYVSASNVPSQNEKEVPASDSVQIEPNQLPEKCPSPRQPIDEHQGGPSLSALLFSEVSTPAGRTPDLEVSTPAGRTPDLVHAAQRKRCAVQRNTSQSYLTGDVGSTTELVGNVHHAIDSLEEDSTAQSRKKSSWCGCLGGPVTLLKFVSFTWAFPLLSLGRKRPVQNEDLLPLRSGGSSAVLVGQLETHFAANIKNKSRWPLLQALLFAHSREIAKTGLLLLSLEVSGLLQAVSLGWLLTGLADDASAETELYGAVVTLAVITLIRVIFLNISALSMWRGTMEIRLSTIGIIYSKILRLPYHLIQTVSTGKVLNVVSNDVEKFNLSWCIHALWISPLEITAIAWIGWMHIGPAILVGLGVLIALIPAQLMLARRYSLLRARTAQQTDARMSLMKEVLVGINLIKMGALEAEFEERVEKNRKDEAASIRSTAVVQGFTFVMFFGLVTACTCTSLIVFTLNGGSLTSTNVFVTLILFASSRLMLGYMLPTAIQNVAELRVTFGRLHGILDLAELGDSATSSGVDPSKVLFGLVDPADVTSTRCVGPVLQIQSARCAWSLEHDLLPSNPAGVSFEASANSLTIVTGAVGVGKSTLLKAVARETLVIAGTITSTAPVLYLPQEPWIEDTTVRANILFGLPFLSEWYERVVTICQLRIDLETFTRGDVSAVGESGALLSGGQRARVALARVVYASRIVNGGNPCIILLDDPFAALDNRVGTAIFDNCVRSVLQPHCIVLATPNQQFWKGARQIVRFHGEGVTTNPCNSAESMRTTVGATPTTTADSANRQPLNSPYHRRSKEECRKRTSSTATPRPSSEIREPAGTASTPTPVMHPESLRLASIDDDMRSRSGVNPHVLTDDLDQCERTEAGLRGSDNETAATGGLSWAMIGTYFRMGGSVFALVAIAVLLVATVCLQIFTDLYLAHWITVESSATSDENDAHRRNYGAAAGGFLVVLYTTSVRFLWAGINASTTAHSEALSGVLRTTLRFFNGHSVGQILNRFGKDVGYLDYLLPLTAYDFLQIGLLCLAVTIFAGTVLPIILVPIVPALAIFIALRMFYIPGARDIKRLEGAARTPIYTHFATTLEGLETIHSVAGSQSRFLEQFHRYQDTHTQAWYSFVATSRWLGSRLDCIVMVLVFSLSVAIVANRGSIDQTQASLALAYMIQLTGLLQWCVRQSAELENQLTSVERVLEYRTLEPESKWVSCGDEVQLCPHHDTYDSAGWPVHGDIDFGSVTMRYEHDLEPVLTDVTFSIKHGQKIGVVGRSGSGKSSLIAALFRMAPTTGLIKIDGIPICTVPLELLRRSLCVIPQKPILFEGTLRSNLDPPNTSTAVAVYSALKNVGLDVSVRLMGGLATTVKDSGSNFSVGERQLLCLARAIINKTHIIVMDEATANIDTETDATIQAVLKQCFADATVIVVAHRLDTILDSNSILVLDKGHLIEQGSPDKLLGNPGSALSQMLPMSHKRKSSATETGPQRPHTAVHTPRNTPRLVPLSKQQPKYLGKMHF